VYLQVRTHLRATIHYSTQLRFVNINNNNYYYRYHHY